MCLKCRYAELGLGFTKEDYKKVCDAFDMRNNRSYRFNKKNPKRYILRVFDFDFHHRMIRVLETSGITQTVNKSSVLKGLYAS